MGEGQGEESKPRCSQTDGCHSGSSSLKFPLETLVLDQSTVLVGRSSECSGTGNGSQAGIGP